MTDSPSRSGDRGRRAVPVILLGLSLLSVGLLTLQAWQAERARRAGAELALDGFAEVVAFQAAASAYSALYGEFQLPFTALEQADPEVRGIDFLMTFDNEVDRCAPIAADRWAMRMGVPGEWTEVVELSPDAEWGGSPPPESERDAMIARVIARLNSLERLWGAFVIDVGVPAPGSTTVPVVLASSKWRPGPEGSSVYVLQSCADIGDRSVFDLILDEHPLLPRAIVGATPGRDLYSLTAAANETVWSWPEASELAAPVSSSAPSATVRLDEPIEQLSVQIALTPAAEAILVPGASAGRTRLILTFGLFGLNGLLLLAAILQFRRESDLLHLREGFVSAVSHELRTPLQQMLIFGDLLRLDRFGSDQEKARAVSVVSRETRRLIHLVENVLAFRPGGASASVPIVASEPYPLDELVENTVEEFAPLAEARRVSLKSDLKCGLETTWHSDAVRRVLLNLIDNAVKYGPADGVVTIATACSGASLSLSVSDQGPGIPPDARRKVLEPYHRGQGEVVQTQGGSGIGLAIVQELVERAGGTIHLADADGGGLRVEIVVPALTEKEGS